LGLARLLVPFCRLFHVLQGGQEEGGGRGEE
jgi:hypothetical protein